MYALTCVVIKIFFIFHINNFNHIVKKINKKVIVKIIFYCDDNITGFIYFYLKDCS